MVVEGTARWVLVMSDPSDAARSISTQLIILSTTPTTLSLTISLLITFCTTVLFSDLLLPTHHSEVSLLLRCK